MKTSQAGVELIKRFEGLELNSYQDIAGVWTIGYGHTETAGPNQHINEREAEELLKHDLHPREQAVQQLVSVGVNQNEFDALVSFVFNVGISAFKNSTARKRLNRNDRVGAADALTWWNKATVNGVLREVLGLTRRRAAERALFLTPVNPPIVNRPDEIAENSRVTPVEEGPRRGGLGESRTIQGATVAGGAGAAASTIGKDSAEELDRVETNIEQGTGLTDKPVEEGGLGGAGANDAATGSSVDGTTSSSTPDGGTTTPTTPPDQPAPTTDPTIRSIEVGSDRPSKHEKHAVDAQLQFALLVIIVLSAIYVIFARVDDWFRYRR